MHTYYVFIPQLDTCSAFIVAKDAQEAREIYAARMGLTNCMYLIFASIRD